MLARVSSVHSWNTCRASIMGNMHGVPSGALPPVVLQFAICRSGTAVALG